MLKLKIYFTLLFFIIFLINCEKSIVNSNNSNYSNKEDILFVRNIKNKYSQLCTINPDSSDINIIYEIKLGKNRGVQYAIWSPDRSKILFEGGKHSYPEFHPTWIIDTNSGEILYQLSNYGGNSVWSPNGKYIFFAKGTGFGSPNDLYRIEIDGKNEELYFHRDSLNIWPWDISIDGEKLLVGVIHYFTNDNNKLDQTFKTGIFDINTKNIKYLYHKGMNIKWANWTSNINELIYIFDSTLYFCDLKNSDSDSISLNITDSLYIDDFYNVTLSPDNEEIAFTYELEKNIYTMDIDNKATTKITGNTSDSISYKIMDW